MNNTENNVLQTIKNKISHFDTLATVTLFGSRAKKNHKNESDWDILILIKNKAILPMLKEEILNIEIEFEICIHALIFETVDWEEKSVMPIYKSIKEEGIVI